MMRLEAITPRLGISSAALVLEVGSGHHPHPRADVLTDRYMEDIERGGSLVTDRPFVRADAGQLPFRSKVFDYVICRQVLEHLEEPAAFFHEVSRVGRAGYIEAPSAVWEWMHPSRDYHKWYVLAIDGELLLMNKTQAQARSPFGLLFESLNRNSAEYRLLIRRYADLFFVRHRWRDSVSFNVEPSDPARRAWFQEPWDAAKVAQYVAHRSPPLQARDLLLGAVKSIWSGLRRRVSPSRQRSRGHRVKLRTLMQCPVCLGQQIRIGEGRAECSACHWSTIIVLPD